MSFVAVSLVALVFAFVGSLPLAGPIALLVVSNGVNGRHKEALRIALGAALAEGIYAFLAFWGFATFLARYRLVLPVSHGVTAIILVALGARFVVFRVKDEPKAKETPPAKPARFWLGFSISALNPTLLATWGAVTTFLYARQIVQFTPALAIPFGAFAGAGIALWGLMMVTLLRRFRHKVPNVALTWIVRGMGVLLIAVGLWSGVALVKYLESPPAAGQRGERGAEARGSERVAESCRRPGRGVVEAELRIGRSAPDGEEEGFEIERRC
jgi:threonine/homoserine/homoserine lactone efflux protein